MLEILSHQYLKKFVRYQKIDWDHVYSFGRIISKSIQDNSTYLINSEIFSTNDWIFAILIPLFLSKEDSIFVLSHEKIEFLKNNQIDKLRNLGFNFILENNKILFPNHNIQLMTLTDLLSNPKNLDLENYRIILSGIEDIKQNLKNYFRISIFKKDWFKSVENSNSINNEIINTYNLFKKKFFSRKSFGNSYLLLDKKEIRFFSKFFDENSSLSDHFLRASIALANEWACWIKLDNTNFEWNFYLEPLDELSQLKKLLTNNKFIFLSALRKDFFFQKYLKNQNLDIDLVINFKSNFCEKKISLYVPPKQMLPNNPLYTKGILDKCRKLMIFRNGLTLVLCDDVDLKTNLATVLASMYGKRVLLETISSTNNEILCASYDWWIENLFSIQTPKQIIIPLLPIPNLLEPINEMTISYNKKLSKDWFREFLLPEAILKLERSIAPLRKNSGKLIILDGRANKRTWGRLLLKSIQPSTLINYMLPFD